MSEPIKRIEAKNLTAQLRYRGVGNPPGTHPSTAISNCFPGLEMDFRNIWKHIFIGIELHESSNLVVAVEADAPDPLPLLVSGYRLVRVNGLSVVGDVTGPQFAGGPNTELIDTGYGDKKMPLEWSNALAATLAEAKGAPVECHFESLKANAPEVVTFLKMRPFFDEQEIEGVRVQRPTIHLDLAPPGALGQSLCSPWQNDYRECACFYWAATRPDFVNLVPEPDGTTTGNNWMQRNRGAETPRVYVTDDRADERLLSYNDLFRAWETELKFIIGGKDERDE
jgi:hypothetical protein